MMRRIRCFDEKKAGQGAEPMWWMLSQYPCTKEHWSQWCPFCGWNHRAQVLSFHQQRQMTLQIDLGSKSQKGSVSCIRLEGAKANKDLPFDLSSG